MTEGREWIADGPSRRFRRYPNYKKSGVEWLGGIPAHWEVKRLKYLTTLNDEVLPESTDPEFEMTYVDIGNVDAVDGIIGTELLTFDKAPSRARRIARKGDVIVSTVRTYLRAITAIQKAQPNLIVSTGFAALRPRQLETSFASYALRAPHFVERVVAHSVGVSYPAINASSLTGFEIAYPDAAEQRAIADFLDCETVRIDALVEKKERLIELLQEKRTALITRAVTRGLDPNVPMKDSGVKWLGEIPANWEMKPLSYKLERITYGFTNPMPTADEGPYMLTALDVGDGQILYENARRTTNDAFERDLTDKSRPRGGDLLLTKDGTLGRVAVADGRRVAINQSIALLRFDRSVHVDFMQHMLLAAPYQDRMAFEAGGTTIKHIYISRLARMPIGIPRKEDQNVISDFVGQEKTKADILIANIQQAVKHLHEYRTALISAAVTGKIDVRKEVG